MTSGRELATLERSDLKSENIEPPVELRMCRNLKAVDKENIRKKNNLHSQARCT